MGHTHGMTARFCPRAGFGRVRVESRARAEPKRTNSGEYARRKWARPSAHSQFIIAFCLRGVACCQSWGAAAALLPRLVDLTPIRAVFSQPELGQISRIGSLELYIALCRQLRYSFSVFHPPFFPERFVYRGAQGI